MAARARTKGLINFLISAIIITERWQTQRSPNTSAEMFITISHNRHGNFDSHCLIWVWLSNGRLIRSSSKHRAPYHNVQKRKTLHAFTPRLNWRANMYRWIAGYQFTLYKKSAFTTSRDNRKKSIIQQTQWSVVCEWESAYNTPGQYMHCIWANKMTL